MGLNIAVVGLEFMAAGDRGGKLLPKLLKPGELTSKEQKEKFRREAGIDGLGDIGRLIEVIHPTRLVQS